MIGLFVIGTVYSWYHTTDKSNLLILVLIFLLGIVYLQTLNLEWQQDKLKQIVGNKVRLKGRVIKAEITNKRASYVVTDLKIPEFDYSSTRRILLTDWYPNSQVRLSYGDRIAATTRLEFPNRQRNPGGFSYRSYLKQQGIYVVGQIKQLEKIGHQDSLIELLFNLKSQIIANFDSYFSGTNSQFLQALLLGVKFKLPAKINERFRELGISHLLVISGFHIGIISYLIYSLGEQFGLSDGLILFLTSFSLGVYLLLVGVQTSSLRAVLLINLVLIGKYFDRKIDLYNLLAGVGLIILLINPRSLFTVSFQLSFGAVIAIVYLAPVLERYFIWLPTRLNQMLTATLAAQVGLFPILAYYFNQVSLGGLIANLLVMPIVSLILWLGMIFIVVSFFSQIATEILAFIIKLLIFMALQLVEWLANYIAFKLFVATPSLLGIIIYYIVVYYLSQLMKLSLIPYSKQYRKKASIIALSLVLLLILQLGFINQQQLKIIFFDVGSADGVYFRLPTGEHILVDAGKNGGEIINFLRMQGINHLDAIFVSHFHKDHVGGVLPIVKKFAVNKVFYPSPAKKNEFKQQLTQIAKNKGIKLIKLMAGDKISVFPINIRAIGPSLPWAEELKTNNNSLVLQVIYKQFRLLLTGDIERLIEQRLVNNRKLKSSILKVAHHGSSTSSTKRFINSVNPYLAIISVGKNNYGHPSPIVINRLKSKGIKVLRTDKKGAITIITDGERYKYNTFLN
ncbi:DNA internalization-related competence protein ComEC/Rec2 [Halobacteroides halobius DSM 5150]|uniref:DNA internalization-related competence protein ComEC/Rec2 n=1 Tax=Halobacteroides halobius (strain ATCC 35273 / DSM 5150 / MD-1) TaxID=748449 RepID=L0K979_HALHC|nr:DNA internalization-related competence protein ComEC/Rec2 [Halobacteroides halobius]AGB41822.1 DNA internalization-related competence protein ComEC/Rec2 [Halobacteroides halobius DSM 5150]